MIHDNTESKDRKLPDPFGVIERAGDFSLMLHALSLILFLETLLLTFKKKNLLTFAWKELDWSAQIGELLVAGLMYSLLLSTLLPFIEALLIKLANTYPVWRILKALQEKDYDRRWEGNVRYSELKQTADDQQSTYLLDMCREAKQKADNLTLQKSQLGTSAFRVMVMLALDIHFSSAEVPSTLLMATGSLSADTLAFLVICVFLGLLGLCMRSWCHDPFKTVWIHYPPLYKEIMAEQARKYRV